MRLNQTADHALRAVLFLAQREPGPACSAETVAEAIGVPRNYMGKVLNTLVHQRVLSSVRGPRGGFRLAIPADDLTLAFVLAPFQHAAERRMCLLGNRACSGEAPCDVHLRWRTMADAVDAFFRETTIAVLLQPTS